MKLIRELRIGPPKSGKTLAVVGSYPKPMLIFMFDVGGLDVIPTKKPLESKDRLTVDILQSDIVWIAPEQLAEYCKKKPEDLPKVTAINFCESKKHVMTEAFTAIADAKPYRMFYKAVNDLVNVGCPWKTFVLDSITSLTDYILQFVSETNGSFLSDARKWSPAVGGKLLQHIAVVTNLNVHCVFIGHSHIDKNEQTGEISTLPLGPGGFAEKVGGTVSQYFYATSESGKLEVWTKPRGNVKAIGVRWPSELPAVVGADYKSIYGKEL